jgi:hypothetical protein
MLRFTLITLFGSLPATGILLLPLSALFLGIFGETSSTDPNYSPTQTNFILVSLGACGLSGIVGLWVSSFSKKPVSFAISLLLIFGIISLSVSSFHMFSNGVPVTPYLALFHICPILVALFLLFEKAKSIVTTQSPPNYGSI